MNRSTPKNAKGDAAHPGKQLDFSYDSLGRLVSVADNAPVSVDQTFVYTDNSVLTSTTTDHSLLGQSITVDRGFDLDNVRNSLSMRIGNSLDFKNTYVIPVRFWIFASCVAIALPTLLISHRPLPQKCT